MAPLGLTVLYPKPNVVDQKQLKVDIVMVHGLGGDPVKSWTHPGNNACWITDFLPVDVPEGRVLSFGYNADKLGNTKAGIWDHGKSLLEKLQLRRKNHDEAKRPIIFIAHSLGGIVVKQALNWAKTEPRYQPIKDCTIGIIFFGTPHRGSDSAAFGKFLTDIANAFSRKASNKLVGALKTNSEVLYNITAQFKYQVPDYQIVSFFETKPTMRYSTNLIVEKHSSLLEASNENQIPVDKNHSDICKFESAEDETYGELVAGIEGMLAARDEQLFQPLNKHYFVPHLLSPTFTGRVDVYEELMQKCLPSKMPAAPTEQKRYVLYGLGGSGKTQVAVKFAQDNSDKFWGVFWIDASNKESAEQGFKQLSKDVFGVEENLGATKMRLSNTRDPWLLVIDNADDPTMDISVYFPTGSRGTILLTTRNPDWKIYAKDGWYYEFGAMQVDDAVALLLRSSGEDVSDANARDTAMKLAELLGWLPLAIIQAGGAIRQGLCTMEEYCEMYIPHHQDLLSRRPVQASSDYEYSVYTTWEVSIDMIKKRMDAEIAENALEFLHVFSFLHFDNIPEDMFKQAWTNIHTDKTAEWIAARQVRVLRNDSNRWDRLALRSAVNLLRSFSLITVVRVGTNRRISMHPLVHAWARNHSPREEQEQYWITAACTLGVSISYKEQMSDYQFRKDLMPHINSCLRLYNEAYVASITEPCWVEIEHIFARAYFDSGLYQKALELNEKALEVRKRTLGAENSFTLAAMSDVALCHSALGRTQKAVELGEEVRDVCRRTRGEDQLAMTLMSNLAVGYFNLGRFKEAVELQEMVLEVGKRTEGEEHADTLTSMNNLASTYSALYRTQEAIELEEKVLEVRRRKLGNDHPHTIASMNNLAENYKMIGRAQDALKLDEEALAASLRTNGEDHPGTLNAMGNLASSYGKIGKFQESMELEKKVLVGRKRILDEDHPHVLMSMYNLAYAYSDLNRFQDAAEQGELVVEARRKKLGEGHPETLRSIHNLASNYHKLGRHQEAVELGEKVVDGRRRALGEEHIETLNSMSNLAVNYCIVGRVRDALELQERVVEVGKRTFGVEDANTRSWIERLETYQRRLREASAELNLNAPPTPIAPTLIGPVNVAPTTIAPTLATPGLLLNAKNWIKHKRNFFQRPGKASANRSVKLTTISMAGPEARAARI